MDAEVLEYFVEVILISFPPILDNLRSCHSQIKKIQSSWFFLDTN